MLSRHRTIQISALALLIIFINCCSDSNRPARAQSSFHLAAFLNPCQPQGVDGPAFCGKYEVFENRATRTGRKIGLNVIVLPALSNERVSDPVFWLHGGPGAAATQTLPAAKQGFLQLLRARRDLIFVDQRGTGESNGLRCDIGDDPSAEVLWATLAFGPGSALPQTARTPGRSETVYDTHRDG
jgi:pimeloyl-ACP methyl ester carboxylesterase